MPTGLIGKKIGMTRIFTEKGDMVPVTVLEMGPSSVVQIKTQKVDGYAAVQLAFDEIPEKRANKARLGHFQKAKVKPHRHLKEFKIAADKEYKPGDEIKVDLFDVGELVDVTGVTKGKGFAGGVKKFGWRGGPASHGSRFHRAPGSIGACATPAEVDKGRNMPGQMGQLQVTVQRLEVMRVDAEKNLLLVKGAVPGANNWVVSVKKSVKA